MKKNKLSASGIETGGTAEEIMKALHSGDNKATKLLNEPEQKCGLTERKRQGLTRPNLIYCRLSVLMLLQIRRVPFCGKQRPGLAVRPKIVN